MHTTTIGAVYRLPPPTDKAGQAINVLAVTVSAILFVRWLGRYSLALLPPLLLLVGAIAYNDLRSIPSGGTHETRTY